MKRGPTGSVVGIGASSTVREVRRSACDRLCRVRRGCGPRSAAVTHAGRPPPCLRSDPRRSDGAGRRRRVRATPPGFRATATAPRRDERRRGECDRAHRRPTETDHSCVAATDDSEVDEPMAPRGAPSRDGEREVGPARDRHEGSGECDVRLVDPVPAPPRRRCERSPTPSPVSARQEHDGEQRTIDQRRSDRGPTPPSGWPPTSGRSTRLASGPKRCVGGSSLALISCGGGTGWCGTLSTGRFSLLLGGQPASDSPRTRR